MSQPRWKLVLRSPALAIVTISLFGGTKRGATALACVQTVRPGSTEPSPLIDLSDWDRSLSASALAMAIEPLAKARSSQQSGEEGATLHLPIAIFGSFDAGRFTPPTVAPTQSAAATPTPTPTPVGHSAVDLTHLPLGDALVLRRDRGQRQPAVGSLWLCGVPAQGRGASNASDWTNDDGSWDFTRKPIVEGEVSWASDLAITLDDKGRRSVTGNALPSFRTGEFPIDPSSIAYRYDRNPSHIEAQTVDLVFDAKPQVAASPSCLPYGATGISLTGNAIYHGASTLGTDAAAYEMLDRCGGQSDGTFTYHTHFLTPCLLETLDPPTGGHSALMGYIMDGFGIYGPRGEDGSILTSQDLDACHGHTHPVEWDGESVDLYHYHWTYDFPYNVGCFKGRPIKAWN